MVFVGAANRYRSESKGTTAPASVVKDGLEGANEEKRKGGDTDANHVLVRVAVDGRGKLGGQLHLHFRHPVRHLFLRQGVGCGWKRGGEAKGWINN